MKAIATKYFYFFLILLISSSIYSQTSIIKGSVIEEATGKSIPGVTVKVINTKLATQSDASGNFIIRNVPVGKQELEFSDFTLETKIISDVETIKGETTSLTVSMAEKNNSLNEVVIKRTKMNAESVASLLTVQKNSPRVSDGISAESIKRTPDRTTSDVLKRISGTSIQDNKFVIIRGLNDRYNTTYLNGSPLPSTEPDKKAFSFDIFPANMLDNLVIYKTATPDLPGEFAGGVIDINTKSTPDKDFQSVSVGTGYNSITTNQTKYEANDKKSSLPSNFPSSAEFIALQNLRTEASVLQIADIAKNYQTNWEVHKSKFDPNSSYQFTIGRFFKLNETKNIGLIASLTNNTSNTSCSLSFNSFDRSWFPPSGDPSDAIPPHPSSAPRLPQEPVGRGDGHARAAAAAAPGRCSDRAPARDGRRHHRPLDGRRDGGPRQSRPEEVQAV